MGYAENSGRTTFEYRYKLSKSQTDKCKIYGKWDVYRDQKNKATQKSIYALAVNFYIYKNIILYITININIYI